MKKILGLVAALCAALVLVSCGSTQVAQAPAQVAPDWVLNGAKASDATYWYAVGEAKMASELNSLKMARMQARTELARIVGTQVKEAIDAKSSMDNNGNETKELTIKKHITTDALLEGSEQIGRYTAPGGTVYVLMSVPKATAVQKLNEAAVQAGEKNTFFTVADLK